MSQQTMRQKARRNARSVTSKRRAALLERAKRMEDLAVQVMTAVGERDAAVAEAEMRAGAALREMTTVEGVTLREAVEWCGDQIGVREATRLRRLVENDQDAEKGGATALAATTTPAASGGAGAGTAVGLRRPRGSCCGDCGPEGARALPGQGGDGAGQ